ncbi:L,D-transpeptidase family protein [Sphingomonas sp. NSE70-1]|uniref:L,D-transpeptidase family protein n=1 Tax=Sphingomonas caseinilyticus TaxID=2908205 RepID=A0ABT0RS88_9SPHN|nr:L,D-transpeptidase family protein [Sphingomonas caseinilyticus]
MQKFISKALALTVLTLLSTAVTAQVTSTPASVPAVSSLQANDDISRFYNASKNAPIWFRSGQVEAAPLLASVLKRSAIEGFTRGPQLAAEVEAAIAKAQTGDPAALQAADRTLSVAWIAYVQALHKPTPGMLYGEKWVTPVVPTSFSILGKALRAPSLAEHIKTISDVNPIYAGLRDAAVAEAQKPGGGNSLRYAANLERARSIPATGKFVLVDAATARLWMYENGRPVDSMKVIVGDKAKLGLPTPMIASVIWYATLNPYWHVPDHMAKKIIAKRVLSDGEAYLKKGGYEVVSDWNGTQALPPSSIDWKGVAAGTTQVKIRQLPGPTNGMGKMKFNFANPEGIYLHDTPNKALFAQSNRALSNGCIRLEDAKRLGRWLMGREPVAATAEAEQHVSLPQGIPVFVTYLTAQPHIGEVALGRDVYGWDPRPSATSAVAAAQSTAAGS